jgi:hypothetical protein
MGRQFFKGSPAWSRIVGACVAGIIFAVLVSLFGPSRIPSVSHDLKPQRIPLRPDVFVGTGKISREGIGSVLLRNRLAILLSQFLEAALIWPEFESEHGYRVTDLLRCRTYSLLPPTDCNITGAEQAEIVSRQLMAVCHEMTMPYMKDSSSALKRLRERFRECRTIHVNSDVPWEHLINQTICTNKYVRRNLGYLAHNLKKNEDMLHVSAHVRMGDIAHHPVMGEEVRHNAKLMGKFVAKLRMRRKVRVTVMTQVKDETTITDIFGNCVLSNNKSIVDSLKEIGQPDILIIGRGSFGILVAQIVRPTVLVVIPCFFGDYPDWEGRILLTPETVDKASSEALRIVQQFSTTTPFGLPNELSASSSYF